MEVEFDKLDSSDLFVDCVYKGGSVSNMSVCCIIKIPNVAKQKWTKLHDHFGQSCKAVS